MESSDGSGMSSFLLYVLRGRWFSVFLSFLIMAGAGATYLFGTYSNAVKALGYDGDSIELMNFFKDAGAHIGIFAGLIAEITPTWFVLLLGAVMNFGGYFTIWLAVNRTISKPEVWQMCVYFFVGATSQNFANTGALVTCIKNFPESRGVVVGLLKGIVGLSGAIITELHYGIYGYDPKSLILIIAWLPAVLSLVSMFTIRAMRFVRQQHELRNFYHYLYVSIGLAVFLMALNLSERIYNFSRAAHIACSAAVVFFFSIILFITLREEFFLWRFHRARENPYLDVTIQKPENNEAHNSSNVPMLKNTFNKPKRGEDHTIGQAIFSVDMFILFVVCVCGMGASLTAIDNIEKIGIALKYPAEIIYSFQSLVSIWNFFGRVFSGFVSESLLQNYKVARPAMLTVSLALSSIGYLLVVFPFNGSVRVASVIIGFTYGCQTPLYFIIISELFGLKYYSTLFNLGQIGMPLGSFLLNVVMVGTFYDKAATKTSIPSLQGKHDMVCEGVDCFAVSFSILSGVAVLGSIISYILWARTTHFYKEDIYKKFRNEPNQVHEGGGNTQQSSSTYGN